MSHGEWFKVRVAVVLIQDDKLLLVRQNNKPFWVLPGGTQELDEGIEECAIREMKEEVNLDVSIRQLLYVSDFMAPDRHVIEFFFLADYVSGELEMETTENINEIGYFSYDEVAQMQVMPQPAIAQILTDWAITFPRETVGLYLGKYGINS